MRTLAFALLAATCLTTSGWAQTAAPPATPPDAAVAPAAPPSPVAPPAAAPAPPAAPAAAAAPAAPPAPIAANPAGGPANICAELVAFLTPKPPPAPAASAPPGAPPPAAAKPGSGSAQEASGQSGVAVEAPKSGAPGAPAGQGTNAPQTSGLSAPIPKPPDPPTKKPSMKLEEAQALAAANDIAGCQAAARKTRREGVDMPLPLLALAALDLKYQERATPAAPLPGATP